MYFSRSYSSRVSLRDAAFLRGCIGFERLALTMLVAKKVEETIDIDPVEGSAITSTQRVPNYYLREYVALHSQQASPLPPNPFSE